MKIDISRRQFLSYGAVAVASAAVGFGFSGVKRKLIRHIPGFKPDPPYKFKPTRNKLLDLPEGFVSHAFSRTGEKMDDGLWVPGKHDGMAALPGPDGKTILIRNHELNATDKIVGPFGWNNEKLNLVDTDKFYDAGFKTAPSLGATTTLVYDTRTGTLDTHFLSLVGTLRNCAGGITPWNTWVTCEETVQKKEFTFEQDHGYNFEVPVTTKPGLVEAPALKAMGRFNHEAVAVDEKTGIVYQTEDRNDGMFYRFIPVESGQLAKGGRLQALIIRDIAAADTRNWKTRWQKIASWTYDPITVSQKMAVSWVDVENVESPDDDLRKQGVEGKDAAMFARGEGIWYCGNSFYFACTNGGFEQKGQIWRYIPSPYEGTNREDKDPGTLELFLEPNDSNLLENADNLTVAPWGDLIICEDGSKDQYIVGVTPDGNTYQFARNASNTSELAGATFSPDGTTLFVNIQNPGVTIAITGPWHEIRQRKLV
ncbi:MAG: DUF839 domain-containing protein [Candidatus Poribacteria bacterium]|nr:DUF839 domain-containing protein [Candidatus Poribacteria bacterium]